MVDNLVNFNVYYVHDCQQVLENLDKKGVANLNRQQPIP
jgi:hypothetical protein